MPGNLKSAIVATLALIEALPFCESVDLELGDHTKLTLHHLYGVWFASILWTKRRSAQDLASFDGSTAKEALSGLLLQSLTAPREL